MTKTPGGTPTHTYQPSVIKIVEMGEGDTFSLFFHIKLTLCMVDMAISNHISRILGKMAVYKREVVDLLTLTKFVYL